MKPLLIFFRATLEMPYFGANLKIGSYQTAVVPKIWTVS